MLVHHLDEPLVQAAALVRVFGIPVFLVCQVDHLERIVLQIVHLVLWLCAGKGIIVHGVFPVLLDDRPDAAWRPSGWPGIVLGREMHTVLHGSGGVGQDRRQVLPLKLRRVRRANQGRERGYDVHQCGERVGGLPLREELGVGEDQRDIDRFLVRVVEFLDHPPVRHGQFAVVGGPHDERILGQAVGIQGVQHLEDLAVHLLAQIGVKARMGALLPARPGLANRHVGKAPD